jgi:hypothetical protein
MSLKNYAFPFTGEVGTVDEEIPPSDQQKLQQQQADAPALLLE